MNLSFKETGRLTLKTFNALYSEYKKNFDIEMILTATRTTYAKAEEQARKADEWF